MARDPMMTPRVGDVLYHAEHESVTRVENVTEHTVMFLTVPHVYDPEKMEPKWNSVFGRVEIKTLYVWRAQRRPYAWLPVEEKK